MHGDEEMSEIIQVDKVCSNLSDSDVKSGVSSLAEILDKSRSSLSRVILLSWALAFWLLSFKLTEELLVAD